MVHLCFWKVSVLIYGPDIQLDHRRQHPGVNNAYQNLRYSICHGQQLNIKIKHIWIKIPAKYLFQIIIQCFTDVRIIGYKMGVYMEVDHNKVWSINIILINLHTLCDLIIIFNINNWLFLIPFREPWILLLRCNIAFQPYM